MRQRIYNNTPLSREYLERHVPSIFTAEKHQSRSDKYAHMPTYVVLDDLEKLGWMPSKAHQCASRMEADTKSIWFALEGLTTMT
jgi:hypothetical protein